MKLPRDVSGDELARLLKVYGYFPTRQSGIHVRLTTQQGGEHHITVPLHPALRLGTLHGMEAYESMTSLPRCGTDDAVGMTIWAERSATIAATRRCCSSRSRPRHLHGAA